jgi:nitrogen fixation protein NifZ
MRRRLPGAADLHSRACRMRSDDYVELRAAPAFAAGDKVRSRQRIRNDGSYLGKQIGETLIDEGETGYVRSIGTFLQRYFIFEVDFVDRGVVVGMRGKELELIEASGR